MAASSRSPDQRSAFYRLEGLFRRENPEASELSASSGNTFPVESSARLEGGVCPSPCLRWVSGSREGRCCTRVRNLHRVSRQNSTSGGLAVGTLNVQGLHWCRMSHRFKLQSVIKVVREQKLDACCLTELPMEVQEAYIEEFVFWFAEAQSAFCCV